jgi:hypothetical protein
MARGTCVAMTDVPPSRYKVVERDRRLVVVDTLTGKPTSAPGPVAPVRRDDRAPAPASELAERPVAEAKPRGIDDRSGARILTTSPLYDLKAPRRIVMDDRFSEKVGNAVGSGVIGAFVVFTIAFMFFPWLIAVPFVLAFHPGLRAAVRRWTTARIDAIQAG